MARPRLRPGDTVWTYQDIARVTQRSVSSVRDRIRRMRIPTYRWPQDNTRILLQSDAERLIFAWLIPVQQRPGAKSAKQHKTTEERADSGLVA